jgi:hypothetical protein
MALTEKKFILKKPAAAVVDTFINTKEKNI